MNYRILMFSVLLVGLSALFFGLQWHLERSFDASLKTVVSEISEIAKPVPRASVSPEQPHPHAEQIQQHETEAGVPLLRIVKLFIRDEGKRSTPYLDTKGIVTIGVGRSLATEGISLSELHAVVPDVDHRYVLQHTRIENGRVYITSLAVAKTIFKQPLTAADVELLLTDDLKSVKIEAEAVFGSHWQQIDRIRQEAILDLVFNLGLPHFKTFVKFIKAVKDQNWKVAAQEVLLSDAARKHVLRYHRIAAVIASGDPAHFELGVSHGTY